MRSSARRLRFVPGAVEVHRRTVSIVELDAGTIARQFRGPGQLEPGPGYGSTKTHHEVIGRYTHAHPLIRPQDRHGHDLCADDRHVNDRDGVAIQLNLDTRTKTMARRPTRSVPIEHPWRVRWRSYHRDSRIVFADEHAGDLHRGGFLDDRGAGDLPDVVTVVRHHAHIRAGDLRIGSDSIDEGRAAGRRREQALENDQTRTPFQDGLECLYGFGV